MSPYLKHIGLYFIQFAKHLFLKLTQNYNTFSSISLLLLLVVIKQCKELGFFTQQFISY